MAVYEMGRNRWGVFIWTARTTDTMAGVELDDYDFDIPGTRIRRWDADVQSAYPDWRRTCSSGERVLGSLRDGCE